MRGVWKPWVVILFGLLLGGCATFGADAPEDPFANLRAFTRADVAQALALASAAKDAGAPYRARCYATLLKHLPEPAPPTPPPTIKGILSGFEVAAEEIAAVRSGAMLKVPEDIQGDCDYLKGEVLRFLGRGALKLAPAPGLGAGGLLLR